MEGEYPGLPVELLGGGGGVLNDGGVTYMEAVEVAEREGDGLFRGRKGFEWVGWDHVESRVSRGRVRLTRVSRVSDKIWSRVWA